MKDNPFQYQNIKFLPILHNRLEFALEVHRQWIEFQPQALAIELPPTLRDPVLTAVKRLPQSLRDPLSGKIRSPCLFAHRTGGWDH